MANAITKPPLATSSNDVVTPLYFDRQVIRADDLTLDRASHDEELARMRRLLHGWGIVSGFAFLDKKLEGGSVMLGKGYGITPNGNEIYLTQPLQFEGLAERLHGCCGKGAPGCDIVDKEKRKELEDRAKDGIIDGWIVARPYSTDSDLRAGVAPGCGHPANALMPTRRCEGIRFDIICDLVYPHVPTADSCEFYSDWMCNVPPTGREPLPMPDQIDADKDYLVIGRLRLTDGVLSLTYEDRRQRLPVSILQNWMTACMCIAKPAPTTTATTTFAPTTTLPTFTTKKPFTTPPIFFTEIPFTTKPPVFTQLPFTTEPPLFTKIPFTTPNIFFTESPILTGPEIADPLINPVGWDVLNNRATANGLVGAEVMAVDNQTKLTAVGIDKPATLLVADLDQVSVATGISKPTLETMRTDIRTNRFLVGGPQF